MHCHARQYTVTDDKNSWWHLAREASHRRPMPFMATGEDSRCFLIPQYTSRDNYISLSSVHACSDT
ncbi:hypothetical protein E2C01_086010 [Portunus trituberculatus]|uniref:Uncharacterized protein n=1 Tax=Portunus trituberculatus TaxID=210409 RepID=A0A5B7J4C0_PORTR|nr:hypothetical protein [Portunus trituberculatus]